MPNQPHAVAYDGVLSPKYISASSSSLGWAGLTTNEDQVPPEFACSRRAYRDHHVVLNLARDLGVFETTAEGLGRTRCTVVVPPGGFVFVPAFMEWGWEIPDQAHILSVRLESSVVTRVAGECGFNPDRIELLPKFHAADQHPGIVAVTRYLGQVVRRQDPNSSIAASLLASRFAELLLWHFRADTRGSNWQPRPNLGRAIELIERRLANPPTIPELALVAGCSPGHFARLFAAEVGCSPIQYRTATRISRAQELLLEPSSSVASVARKLGFDRRYLPNFTRAFKAHTGETPTEFRRRHGE